ncbi:MAG: hypothetical protein ACKO34_00710 [Vampirovibrionales bacterium]
MNLVYKTLLALTLTIGSFSTVTMAATTHATAPKAKPASQTVAPTAVATSLTLTQLVSNPTAFLKKAVKLEGTVATFSSLGLDYKPVYRNPEQFITLLLFRDDVPNTIHIPLTELKLFVNRTLAEKHKDLGPNDVIQLEGSVVSDALGDAWVDVTQLTVVKKVSKEASSH